MRSALIAILVLLSACSRGQSGILGIITTQTGTNPNIQMIAAAAPITAPANLVGMTFTDQAGAITLGDKFLDDNMVNGTQAGVSTGSTFTTNFTIPFFGAEVPVTSGLPDLYFRHTNGDELGAEYTGTQLQIYKKVSGTKTVLATTPITLTTPYTIGLEVALKTAVIWIKPNGGSWDTKTGYLLTGSDFDFTNPSTLAAFTTVGVRSTGSFATGTIRYGYTQGVRQANQTPITFADGTPFIKNGEAYYFCSVVHPCASSDTYELIHHSHAAILKVNLSTYAVTVVARIATNRGGVLYGENSGAVTYDQDRDTFVFLIPSWGSYANGVQVQTYKYETSAFPTGAVLMSGGVQLNFGNGRSNYDPDYKKIGGVHYMAITYTSLLTNWSNFYVALYSSTDLVNWTLAGSDESVNQEGTKLIKIGGNWRVLAATVSANTVRVYNMSMGFLGNLSAPTGISYPSSPSHPTIIANWNGGNTDYYWLIFDDNRWYGGVHSWGHLRVAKATTSQTGHDYDHKEYTLIE